MNCLSAPITDEVDLVRTAKLAKVSTVEVRRAINATIGEVPNDFRIALCSAGLNNVLLVPTKHPLQTQDMRHAYVRRVASFCRKAPAVTS